MPYLEELAKQQDIKKEQGKNFTAIHCGPFNQLEQYEFQHPLRKRLFKGKLFAKDHLGLTGMQISYTKLPAGTSMPFTHKHKENEELYIVVQGRGQVLVDQDIIDIEEGSTIRVDLDGDRCLRASTESDLIYICIQARNNSLNQDTFDDGIPGQSAPNWQPAS